MQVLVQRWLCHQIVHVTRDTADEDEATIPLLRQETTSKVMNGQLECVQGPDQIDVDDMSAWFGGGREGVCEELISDHFARMLLVRGCSGSGQQHTFQFHHRVAIASSDPSICDDNIDTIVRRLGSGCLEHSYLIFPNAGITFDETHLIPVGGDDSLDQSSSWKRKSFWTARMRRKLH